MSLKNTVVITGVAGGLGESLAQAFRTDGWRVVGVDVKSPEPAIADAFIRADLNNLCVNAEALEDTASKIRKEAGTAPVKALVNNAAVQNLGALDELSVQDILETFNVNICAPFLLSKALLSDLKREKGVILNIGSVHAVATKPRFSAYATSKAALHGMARAMAVDLGPDVRVLTLAPAATATEMLKAGFQSNLQGLEELANCHPVGRIADPEEIAEIALFLVSSKAGILSGATIYADGGVLSRLHDPD